MSTNTVLVYSSDYQYREYLSIDLQTVGYVTKCVNDLQDMVDKRMVYEGDIVIIDSDNINHTITCVNGLCGVLKDPIIIILKASYSSIHELSNIKGVYMFDKPMSGGLIGNILSIFKNKPQMDRTIKYGELDINVDKETISNGSVTESLQPNQVKLLTKIVESGGEIHRIELSQELFSTKGAPIRLIQNIVDKLNIIIRKCGGDSISVDTLNEMIRIDTKHSNKSLYIVRGMPGSGKSTLAKELCNLNKNHAHCENDQYFEDGTPFNGENLTKAKSYCFKKAKNAIESGVDVVVVSNVFTQPHTYAEYVKLGETNGYKVFVLISDKENPKSIHNVPDQHLKDMSRNFYMNSMVGFRDPKHTIVYPKSVYDAIAESKTNTISAKIFEVDGVEITNYSYYGSSDDMFFDPFNTKSSNIYALNMRGMCFVGDQLYLGIPKFFNLNQNQYNRYERLKHIKIKHVLTKHDGSMIMFILVNGKVVPKTIGYFDNEMCRIATNLITKDKELYDNIYSILMSGNTPIYELTSPYNKVVLDYQVSKLEYLGYRENNHPYRWIPNVENDLVDTYPTLDSLMEASDQLEGVEGWVIIFENGEMVKVKTEWYFGLHFYTTDYKFQTNRILTDICDRKIDDIKSKIQGDEVLGLIKSYENLFDRMYSIVNENSKALHNKITEFKSILRTADENREFYANLSDKEKKYLSILPDDDELIRKFILKKVFHLQSANKFIEAKNDEEINFLL